MGTASSGKTIYTKETRKEVLRRLERGETLNSICRDDDMPSAAIVHKWRKSKPEFRNRYERAREIGYSVMADDLLDIADTKSADEEVMRSRLRVDTRKWLMSKALPKIYGDKLTHEGAGKNGEFEIKFIFES